jgi:hypothetical protein
LAATSLQEPMTLENRFRAHSTRIWLEAGLPVRYLLATNLSFRLGSIRPKRDEQNSHDVHHRGTFGMNDQ